MGKSGKGENPRLLAQLPPEFPISTPIHPTGQYVKSKTPAPEGK